MKRKNCFRSRDTSQFIVKNSLFSFSMFFIDCEFWSPPRTGVGSGGFTRVADEQMTIDPDVQKLADAINEAAGELLLDAEQYKDWDVGKWSLCKKIHSMSKSLELVCITLLNLSVVSKEGGIVGFSAGAYWSVYRTVFNSQGSLCGYCYEFT